MMPGSRAQTGVAKIVREVEWQRIGEYRASGDRDFTPASSGRGNAEAAAGTGRRAALRDEPVLFFWKLTSRAEC